MAARSSIVSLLARRLVAASSRFSVYVVEGVTASYALM